MKNLLLLSSSEVGDSDYLGYCQDEIRNFFGSIKRILFIPYARPSGITYGDYTNFARPTFEKLGYALDSIHELLDHNNAIENAEGVFVGGGNTFVLLDAMQRNGIINTLQGKVQDGLPYIGSSAGTVVAAPTIKTTNDMPVVLPKNGFSSLDFVPFQINPHYVEPDPNSTHRGETRDQRIFEYLQFNLGLVVGLKEGAWLRVHGDSMELRGTVGARVFTGTDEPPKDYQPICSLDFLL